MAALQPPNQPFAARIFALDALRGLAVFLMMEQHLGVWLWNNQITNYTLLSFLIAFNALGGAAAPLFITLAGTGCSLLFASRPHVDRLLVRRGLVLFMFAILLNVLTPSWFSLGSWFVLHMMAFAMVTSPLWCRLSNRVLLGLLFAIPGVTVWIHHWLNTPLIQLNERMSSMSRPGGALRLAIAEGHFPIFPWLSMFLLGILVGRWIQERAIRKIVFLALGTGSLALLLSLFAQLSTSSPAFAFFTQKPWERVIVWNLGFYPAHPRVFLLLQTIVLVVIAATLKLNQHWPCRERNVLVCLGRISLTLLIVHVVVFRELTRPVGLWHGLSSSMALVIIGLWTMFSVLVARTWQKYHYRYGAEWLLRKLAG